MQRPAVQRKLTRSRTISERFEDAGQLLQRSVTLGREAVMDGADLVSFVDLAGTLEAVLEKQEEQEAAAVAAQGEVVGQESVAAAPEAAAAAQEAAAPAAAKPSHSMFEAIGRGLLEPTNLVLRDKVSFLLGVVDLASTAYWMGRSPGTYYHYWVAKSLLLFTLRYFTYKVRGWHYMMIEFCYFANLLGVFVLYVDPQNALLRKLAFSHMAGPLTWAIVAMRNSLVFHDLDKMTTLMMHASPALVAWSMRWHPRPEWTVGMGAEALRRYEHASWAEMALLPMAFYLLWSLIYYLLTFLLLARRMAQRHYINMFTLMVLNDKAKKSALARLVLRAPRALQPVAYLGMHMLASWVAVLPTKLLWDHFWAHTLVLGAVLLQSIWNGANFYFRVFAKKYMGELQAHEAKRAAAKAD